MNYFQKCIESFSGSACDCKADFEKPITQIPAGAEKTCWDTVEAKYDEVKAAKKACANKGGPSGSFFNCMAAVKASPGQISGCGITMMTTGAPSGRLLKLNHLFKKFQDENY